MLPASKSKPPALTSPPSSLPCSPRSLHRPAGSPSLRPSTTGPCLHQPHPARGPTCPHLHPPRPHPLAPRHSAVQPHLDVWHPSAHVEVIEVLVSPTLHHVGACADVGFARPGLERVIAPGLCEESVEVETCHGQGCLAAASAEGAPALAVHGECPVVGIPMRMSSGTQGVWPGLKKITAVSNTKWTRQAWRLKRLASRHLHLVLPFSMPAGGERLRCPLLGVQALHRNCLQTAGPSTHLPVPVLHT